MLHSYNEDEFKAASSVGLDLLRGYVTMTEKFQEVIKHRYAKYIVRTIPGNMDRHGSSRAEQNHSSYVQRIGASSMESVSTGISHMLEHQCQLGVEFELYLAKYFIKMHGKRNE